MVSDTLVRKLAEAEASVVAAIDGKKAKKALSDAGREHALYEALNSIRSALLVAREDDPLVERAGYAATAGEGLGKSDSVTERHESFGVISVSKPVGSMRLVGAMVDSLPTCIELRVGRARREIDRHLHTEHYFQDGRDIIRVRLSTYQWAELLCSLTGGYVPCTLDTVMGVHMDPVPDEVKTPLEQIAHDTRAAMFEAQSDPEGKFNAAIDAVLAKIGDLGLSKTKAAALRQEIEGLRKHTTAVKATVTWASQRLTEDTERTLGQARAEMAAALQSLYHREGLNALQQQHLTAAFQLSNGNPG